MYRIQDHFIHESHNNEIKKLDLRRIWDGYYAFV